MKITVKRAILILLISLSVLSFTMLVISFTGISAESTITQKILWGLLFLVSVRLTVKYFMIPGMYNKKS
jgi:hypothetical protein